MWWNHRYIYLFKLTCIVSISAILQVYDNQSYFLANNPSVSLNGTDLYVPVGNTGSDQVFTVSSLYSFFLFDTTFANEALGWCLFVAAMTPNRTLRSDLIRSVHDRASLYGGKSAVAVPLTGLNYITVDSDNGPNIRIGR
jgi:hypothetical protein